MSAAPKIGLSKAVCGRRSGRLDGIGPRAGATRLEGVGVVSGPERLGRVGTRFVEGLGSMRLKAGWAMALVALLALPATASAQSNDTTVKAPVIVQGHERATRSATLERADDRRVEKAIRDAEIKPVDVAAIK